MIINYRDFKLKLTYFILFTLVFFVVSVHQLFAQSEVSLSCQSVHPKTGKIAIILLKNPKNVSPIYDKKDRVYRLEASQNRQLVNECALFLKRQLNIKDDNQLPKIKIFATAGFFRRKYDVKIKMEFSYATIRKPFSRCSSPLELQKLTNKQIHNLNFELSQVISRYPNPNSHYSHSDQLKIWSLQDQIEQTKIEYELTLPTEKQDHTNAYNKLFEKHDTLLKEIKGLKNEQSHLEVLREGIYGFLFNAKNELSKIKFWHLSKHSRENRRTTKLFLKNLKTSLQKTEELLKQNEESQNWKYKQIEAESNRYKARKIRY